MDVSDTKPYFRWALLLVAAVALTRLYFLTISPFTLFADEAQYWTWAKRLDFGYYSKPPMVAWLIAATTSVCGDGTACVRLSAPLLHAGTAMLLYGVGARLFSPRVGFWSAAMYVLLPGVAVSSYLIATDAPLLFFWALALYALVRALEDNRWRWWLLLGAAFGLGCLSKYTMAVFLPSMLLYFCFSPQRAQLRNTRLWAAIAVGLLIYSPNLVWNAYHGFVSYKHTGDNTQLVAEAATNDIGKKLEFLGAQFGVFGPLLFAALLWILFARGKTLLRDERMRLLACLILPLFVSMVSLSLLTRALANWMAPVYVAASVLVCVWLVRGKWVWVLPASLALHGAVSIAYGAFDPMTRALNITFPAKQEPFWRLRGWSDLAAVVEAKRNGLVVLTNDRKLTATLIYELRDTDARIYKWNADGMANDWYDQVADFGDAANKDALLILKTGMDAAPIAARFARRGGQENIEIPVHADYHLRFTVEKLSGFKGYGEN